MSFLVHVFIFLYPTCCGRFYCSKHLPLFSVAAFPVMTLLMGELYIPPPVNSDSVASGLLWLRKCEWKLLKVRQAAKFEGTVLQTANSAQAFCHQLQGGRATTVEGKVHTRPPSLLTSNASLGVPQTTLGFDIC